MSPATPRRPARPPLPSTPLRRIVTIGVVTQGGSYATSQTPTVTITDAATWTVTLNGSPYTTGTPIGEGVWTIVASATDEFGRTTTAAVDFEIDTSAPDVTIGVVTQGGSYATSQTPTVTIADAATWTVTLNGSPVHHRHADR